MVHNQNQRGTRQTEGELNTLGPTLLYTHMSPSFLELTRKLQDALSKVDIHDLDEPSQVVVVGSQSSGTSSVLENIVGRRFLPCGPGLVTRRPLVLQLINRLPTATIATERCNKVNSQGRQNEPQEWGEFLHQPGVKYTDYNRIMDEIISETDAKTGDSGISQEPINLRIFSPHVVTITLVDLPGLTRLPIRGQPKDIEKQLRKMALKYITPPNVIILAVTPANTNLTNSDGLTLAREVDPKGARTIGVLTKIDLMDAGTDVVDVLDGCVIPLPLGYVPVINRSQRDIDMGKSISQSLKEELSFFENHSAYKIKSQYYGIPFLSWKLALIMKHQIFTTLPDVEEKIQAKLKDYQNELPDLDSMSREGPAGVGLAIITKLCNEFSTVIAGNIAKSTVPGVNYTFVIQELLTEGVESLNPADQVTEEDAQMVSLDSSSFLPFILRQIEKLKGPSLACVERVYDELVRIVKDIVSKEMFKRLPQLKDPIYQATISYLERQRIATNIFVSDLISTEGCNVITGHYDHFSGQTAMPLARERDNPSTIIQPVNSQGSNSSTATASPRLSSEPKPTKRGLVRLLSRKKKNKGTGYLDVPPAIPDANRNLLDYEQTDLKELGLMVSLYFEKAKPIITVAVPNAIMLNLVNTAKDELLRELLPVLGKMKNLNEVFEASRKRQKECIEMTEALNSAQALLAELKGVFSQRS